MDYGLAFKLNEELYNNNIEFKKINRHLHKD